MRMRDWRSEVCSSDLVDVLSRLFRLERGEGPRLLQFGLFGFLLQMGMGVGFSAGDAAFLTHVGADKLPLVFMATPAVMLIYTLFFSYLLVRFSIDRSEEHTSELQSLMRISYAVFCLKKTTLLTHVRTEAISTKTKL